MTGKDVLAEKEVLKKAAALKRFEYSSLGCELKKQTKKKQYQELNKLFKCDRNEEEQVIIKKEKPAITSASKLLNDNKYSLRVY